MDSKNKDDHWPCACVKRDGKGNLTHIKMNDPSVKKCSVCKCKKPPALGFTR